MEPSLIESYLRSTCAVLDFDIGELWCARKMPDEKPTLKFLQLYTSPTYEDFHSLLIRPDKSQSDNAQDEDKHRFSPIICRGVCDGGQIVWANTRISDDLSGLLGRTDLPLNTAVGVPICSIGFDLYILVLFAIGLNYMTPNAIEYLCSVATAVTQGSGGFLKVSVSQTVTTAKTEEFVGLWDMTELINKYSSEVEFHLLPINRLQRFFDIHEILLFCDLFQDFKIKRDGRFTAKQLDSLREALKQRKRERSDSISSVTWGTAGTLVHQFDELESRSTDTSLDGEEPGIFNIDLNSIEVNDAPTIVNYPVASPNDSSTAIVEVVQSNSFHSIDTNPHNLSPFRDEAQNANKLDDEESILHIYAHMSYKISQCRFHEFMIAILGMTLFDCAELWLYSDRTKDLFLVAAVYRSRTMHKWTSFSESMRLQLGEDIPGKVMESSQSYWDPAYNLATENSPRSEMAKKLRVLTAFGVPLPGLKGTCGTVAFYSSKSNIDAEPLMVHMIETGVQLMAISALDPSALARLDIENIVHAPLLPYCPPNPVPSTISTNMIKNITNYNPTASQINGGKSAAELYVTHKNRHPTVGLHEKEDFNSKLEKVRTIVDMKSSLKSDNNNSNYSYNYSNNNINNNINNYNQVFPDNMLMETYPAYSQENNRYHTTSNQIPSDLMSTSAHYNISVNNDNYYHDNAGGINSSLMNNSTNNNNNNNYSHNDNSNNNNKIRNKKEIYENAIKNAKPLSTWQDPFLNNLPNNGEVFAAIALANMDKVSWNTFLEGSNNEQPDKSCSKNPMNSSINLLDSQKIIGFFDNDGQNDNNCKIEGCGLIAEKDTIYCINHRGTRRCQKEGCTKCAQGATKFCIGHGGGRRCTHPGCFKGARDKYFCAAH
eukprot:gene8566-11573_t